MLKFTGKIPKIKFDGNKFKQKINTAIGEILFEGARRWFDMVWNNLPVDTGEALGSLYQLGLDLGLSPAPRGGGFRVGSGLRPYNSRIKSFENGRHQQEHFIGQVGDYHWRFQWRSNVLQLNMNTQFAGLREKMQNKYQRTYAIRKGPYLKHETPWMIIQMANYELILYVRDNIDSKLPSLAEAVSITYQRVG